MSSTINHGRSRVRSATLEWLLIYFQICFHHWFTTILLTFVCRIVCKRNLVVRRFQSHFSPERQERFSVRGGEKKGCSGGAIRLGKCYSNLPATSPFMVGKMTWGFCRMQPIPQTQPGGSCRHSKKPQGFTSDFPVVHCTIYLLGV